MLQSYLNSLSVFNGLRRHPGTPIACAMTAFGFIAGYQGGGFKRALLGAALMSIYWIPVLLTARKNERVK